MLKALKADDLQHLHDPLPDLLLGDLHHPLAGGVAGVGTLLHPQAESDVLKHVQVGEQRIFLKDGIDLPLIGRNVINPHTVKEDVSARRGREAANNPQCGGFTAPTGP